MTVMCLSDLGQVITGNTPSKSIDDFYDSEDICFVKPSDFYSNSLSKIDKTENYLSEKARCVSRIVPKGSILVTCIGIIGKVAVLNGDAAFNQQINAIIPDKKKVLPMYLAYSLLSKQQELAWQANAAVVPIINKSQFSKLQLDIPDIDSQNKIISVLSKVDTLTTEVKKQLEDFDLLIKSRFIEMFGDPVTNEKGWVKVRLADKCCIITGNTPPRANEKYYGSYIEWIKSDNITSSMYLTKAVEYLSEEGLAVGRKVESGSVLMTCIAGSLKSIGNVAIADRPVTFNQQINAVVTNEQNTLFMYEQFKLTKEYITCGVNMALKGILSKGQLSEKQFIFPPIELQNQFADFVAQVDKSKLAVQQSLKELETLKKSLMQQYFG